MNPLLEQFLQEARENLKFIEQNLEDLGSGDAELMNSIFRAAHTLKGGAGLVGFESVKIVTHKAEDLLDMLRANKIAFHEDMIDVLYDAFDEVVNLVEAAEESGDVVEGDSAAVESIASKLAELMGQSQEESQWELPFQLITDKEMIINKDLPWLKAYKNDIPFFEAEITENNLEEKRLYAIFIDPEEDCMVYGNDPLYAFSLLEESLIDISCCTSSDLVKSILAGEDEEGLELKIQFVVFAYASWDLILEALYNFSDDLYILPLDVSTLLEITKGESGEVQFLKDIRQAVESHIDAGDKTQIKNSLSEGLNLLNPKSKEYMILDRIENIIDNISENELSNLSMLFDSLEGTPSLEKPQKQEETKTTETEQTQKDQSNNELQEVEVDKQVINFILSQQLEQLEGNVSRETLERVVSIVNKCADTVGTEKVESDLEKVRNYISEYLGEAPNKDKTECLSVKQKDEPKEEKKTSSPPPRENSAPKKEQKKDVIGKIVKVEQESIDHLMGVVGEILVAKNSLPYLAESATTMDPEATKRAILEKYSFINRLTNQLQDIVMSMRMLPMTYVFDRYPKLVRDMSKNLGKKIKLIQEGGDTKLDKNMIEMLADPLVHIVRNSLDHGIELPEVRKEKGKDENGTVTMRAYPQSDKVYIEIVDDGKGVDGEIVARKVMEKGLLPLEKIEAMSDEEKAELIMLPGLSTVDQISEYSGRGVGMDVVKRSVEGFGGTVSVRSKLGEGTTITMAVPVSLAVTTLLHVMMGDNHYGFPMDSVSETVKLEESEITYLHNRPFVYIREQIIPLIFQEGMIDKSTLKGKPLSIVVLNIKGNPVAVVVNELLGQLDVVQKPLDGILSEHPVLGGTALLGNGQIIMVIDPIGLLEVGDIPEEIPTKEDLEKAQG